MHLKTYLKEKGKSQRELSKELDVHCVHLNSIIRGRRKPSPSLALRIEEATGGKVTLRELLFPEETRAE